MLEQVFKGVLTTPLYYCCKWWRCLEGAWSVGMASQIWIRIQQAMDCQTQCCSQVYLVPEHKNVQKSITDFVIVSSDIGVFETQQSLWDCLRASGGGHSVSLTISGERFQKPPVLLRAFLGLKVLWQLETLLITGVNEVTHLFIVAWRSGTVLLNWPAGIFFKGYVSIGGIPYFQLPRNCLCQDASSTWVQTPCPWWSLSTLDFYLGVIEK